MHVGGRDIYRLKEGQRAANGRVLAMDGVRKHWEDFVTELDFWRAEVVALHEFISAWIRGDLARSNERFRIEFAEKLHRDFVNVQPAGRVLARALYQCLVVKQCGPALSQQ